MIVCSCKAVTDRTTRAAIADGAESIDDLMHRCGAGTSCGGCWPELERLIHSYGSAGDAAAAAVA
jgi:bacterioferritin-associated ferredoxin